MINQMKGNNKISIVIAISTLIVGFGLGWLMFGRSTSEEHLHEAHTEIGSQTWTCSMHPQIRQPEFGKCPLCGMDLIPLGNNGEEDNPMAVRMSPTAMQLANVQTSVTVKVKPIKEVRLNGKVQADERYIFSQTSHLTGRIEQLLVSYTGEYISKGQIIAYIYSPDLVTAQKELFEAEKVKDVQPALFKAVRDKLKNWKLSDKQIDDILEAGIPLERFPILSDLSGSVISKRVNLGDHILSGSSLFEVADLSKIWILFDIYESDMSWVKLGDKVHFQIQSLPGEKFEGKISFIDPVINSKTRVAKARIALNNPAQRLKPEMFVKGTLESPLKEGEAVIVVPKSALMWTGERSVVYVKSNEIAGISFMMREVSLGPALGDSFIINEGLEEGEEIATHGTFSIDAAAQLAGKPSMMNRQMANQKGELAMTEHNHEEDQKLIKTSDKAKKALQPLFDNYIQLKDVLVNEDYDKVLRLGNELKNTLGEINRSLFEGASHNIWMKHRSSIQKVMNTMVKTKDIVSARNAFIDLSNQMIAIAKIFGPFENTFYIQHCPMVNNDKGADWLSLEKEIKNPYYGASMLTCGNVKEELKTD